MSLGDSRTQIPLGTDNPWQAQVLAGLLSAGERVAGYTDGGVNGARVTVWGAAPTFYIDTKLAAIGTTVGYPKWVLLNLGINDRSVSGMTQAQFETAYIYIVDAVHAKWPMATLYLTLPWGSGADAYADTIAGYITNVVAARSSFCVVGNDERVWFKPNVATLSTDGLHWNSTTPGNAAGAAANLTSMGY